MSDRAAQAAAQSDPARNPNFRRTWGCECGAADAIAQIRVWHSDDDPALFLKSEQRQAERTWRRLTREAQP